LGAGQVPPHLLQAVLGDETAGDEPSVSEKRETGRERERRVSVYEEAPGFRLGPRPVSRGETPVSEVHEVMLPERIMTSNS